jgi:hypothetical protein
MLNIQLLKDQVNKFNNYRNECRFQVAWKKRNENKVLQAFLLAWDCDKVLHLEQFCFIPQNTEDTRSIIKFLLSHNFYTTKYGYNTLNASVAYYNDELNLCLDVVSAEEFKHLQEAIQLAVGVAKAEDTRYLLSTVFDTYMTQVFNKTKLRT